MRACSLSPQSTGPRGMLPGTVALAIALTAASATFGKAATMAPPMLDISQQCEAGHKRNATAMSECVVAESEARAEILQRWNGTSDASAEKCLKVSKKARKLPYSAMARCLSGEALVAAPVGQSQAGERPASGEPPPGDGKPAGGLLKGLGCFFGRCAKSGS